MRAVVCCCCWLTLLIIIIILVKNVENQDSDYVLSTDIAFCSLQFHPPPAMIQAYRALYPGK